MVSLADALFKSQLLPLRRIIPHVRIQADGMHVPTRRIGPVSMDWQAILFRPNIAMKPIEKNLPCSQSDPDRDRFRPAIAGHRDQSLFPADAGLPVAAE